ncbi:MAG: hypothetical protein ACK5A0_13900 [Polaromonas sp.]|jgi:hypothetical protein
MSFKHFLRGLLVLGLMLQGGLVAARPALELEGFMSDSGAITILHKGDTSDPYFAMQALLLAHDNGLDISVPAEKFANWLVGRQKPDGTFDRFCQGANKTWVSCKTADADDSLLALWMRLLDTMPKQLGANPAWLKSYMSSKKSLDHLYQPSRGVYMVSPVYLHGLFMDNLEVWSLKAHSKNTKPAELDKLAKDIYATFWQAANQRFLVSTQLEQQTQKPQFYPDHVAQIFPLLVDFPLVPQTAKAYYRNWMRLHRAEWLGHGETDYPWGVLAVLALRQGDEASARCWLRETATMRRSTRWAVTDEASFLILASRRIQAADKNTSCT